MVLALNLGKHNRMFENKGVDVGVPTPIWNTPFTPPPKHTRIGKFFAHAMQWGQETLDEMIDKAIKKETPNPQDINLLIAVINADGMPIFASDEQCVNSWATKTHWKGRYCHLYVQLFRSTEGKTTWQIREIPSETDRRFDMLMRSFNSRDGSSTVHAEQVAARKLHKMLSKEQHKQYVLCDMFAEIGKSGVVYFLRKNRPTIATRDKRVLCTMCTHPAGYYTGTWTGALPPSDDVIAHLEMIRADEHYFWRKCNQIQIEETNSGI